MNKKRFLVLAALMGFWVAPALSQQPYAIIPAGSDQQEIIKTAASITPSARQMRWQQLELTAFFHFGINTFTGQEWGTGKEDPKVFDPKKLDASQWVKTAKDAGFKQVILTAKHHDGFCLWPTATTAHSVKMSPWKKGKGDVVKEVAAACKKYGIGFGIYLSPWDMNAPQYGSEAYNQVFLDQLTELLTWYGQVDEVWFDGANGEGSGGKKQVYDFERWYAHIRKLQPGAVIAVMGPDVRWVGTETGYGRDTEWSVLPASNLSQQNISANSQQDMNIKPSGFIKGADIGSRDKLKEAKSLVWYPAETDVSIRPGWFYHADEDKKIKTPEKLTDIYYSSVGKNSVLLMNIPPNKDGLIDEHDRLILSQWTRIRKETFKKNLAKDAVFTCKNGLNEKALLDGDYLTNWTTKENDSTATLEITLPKAMRFDVVMLQENISIGQRIEEFSLEYLDKDVWKQLIKGTTVGYKRLLRFDEVSTTKLRLHIGSSRLNPTLSEFGLFKQAK
ncbi:alpha-L-fucosidase [Pedobacter rhizosphaerae]|uniref:alpha-L-fucosidase n=1 Tax=Pedobacter rhizosphaerae TaxID=390241 RepID=A0A1H9T4J6_9SPHI|nr:alpha-L-fucosidase [Pedobacter rhizosphaerae]SER91669.1 alpha-L-fucosidase [Pedobacter rhizosphaerae]